MFGKQAARYDLRLGSSCFFASTNQSTSSPSPITGRLCVTFPQAVWVNRIKLILTRALKIPVEGTITTKDREHITHVQELELASSKTHRPFNLPPGDYEFPFEIPLREIVLETVTGPGHNYRTYRIDAIVERTYWKDTIVSQPLRIYNAPNTEWNDINSWYPLTVEGQSDQNILHCASIPSSHIPFGSTFSIACGFQVPSKDVKLRTVTIEVIEKHKLLLDATAAEAALGILHITSAKDLTVFRERLEPVPESGLVSCTGTEWCISTQALLPVSFDLCSQSVMTRTVKIMHSLVITSEFEHENGELFDTVCNSILEEDSTPEVG
ncbi:uncharacterized protein APUU_60338A [Aspergillus puulaauensis]|uniref:Arrestin-like N-terminal domain-containing protein n=1 Tax=Aspergillus puulaauensis TaxID=1220207 RepID=A0A7R7XT74_9EURO|nr:uncharacterized protein APUU_60338A [Aspergillus puulaauensis]BCS27290.1 hypothetical protein APUU_60338A [Aspergillus puulaauensis]